MKHSNNDESEGNAVDESPFLLKDFNTINVVLYISILYADYMSKKKKVIKNKK